MLPAVFYVSDLKNIFGASTETSCLLEKTLKNKKTRSVNNNTSGWIRNEMLPAWELKQHSYKLSHKIMKIYLVSHCRDRLGYTNFPHHGRCKYI